MKGKMLSDVEWAQELSVLHHYLSHIVDDNGLEYALTIARDSKLFSERLQRDLDKIINDDEPAVGLIALADARGEARFLETGTVDSTLLTEVAETLDRELARVNRIPYMKSPAYHREVQKELLLINQLLQQSGLSAGDKMALKNSLGRVMVVAQKDVGDSLNLPAYRSSSGYTW